MAWTIVDKYIPQEWLNSIFSEVRNCEIITRPSGKGFQNPLFYFKKRAWLVTKVWINAVPLWDTLWNQLASKYFNGKIYLYTTQWYIYDFDWTNLNPVVGLLSKTTDISWTWDLIINAAASVTWVWQEFTPVAKTLVKNIKVKVKKDATTVSSCVQTMMVTTAAAKWVIIATAREQLVADNVDTAYSIKSFEFDWLELTAWVKYFFYITATNTSGTSRLLYQWNSAVSYASHQSFNYNGTTFSANSWTMWFEVYWTSPLTIDTTNYEEDILDVNYLSWSRFPSSAVEYTVSSYNNTTGEITTVETTLTPAVDYIGKYAYISAWWTAKYQQRWIADIPANNKILLTSTYNIDPVAWDKIQIFTSILPQLWFPQLRKWSTDPDKKFLFAIDSEWNTKWIYMPERKRLTFWDNRVIQLTKDSQALLASSNIDYEIPITTTVNFGNAKALNIVPYWWYIIAFFDNKIWLVKKDIIDATAWTFAYLYQDILDIGLYSENAFLVNGWELYIFGSDRRFYSIDLSAISLWEIIAKPVDIWDTLVNYFNALSWWDIRLYYNNGNLYIVHRSSTWASVFKYNKFYKAWITDDYAFSKYTTNFFNFFYNIWSKSYTISWNRIYNMWWLIDDDTVYKQNVQIYGPVQSMFDIVKLLQAKIRMWFDWVNKVAGKWSIEVWWNTITTDSRDFSKVEPLSSINAVLSADGALWGSMVWETQYWWVWETTWNVSNLFPEIFDVGMKIGLQCGYFKLNIYNDEQAQMYLGGVEVMMNVDNAQFINNKSIA